MVAMTRQGSPTAIAIAQQSFTSLNLQRTLTNSPMARQKRIEGSPSLRQDSMMKQFQIDLQHRKLSDMNAIQNLASPNFGSSPTNKMNFLSMQDRQTWDEKVAATTKAI